MITGVDHVHGQVEPEDRAREGQRAAPLAGAGFRGQPSNAVGFVVVSLGDGGVGLVAAGGTDALVLVVDVGGGIEGTFEPAGAEERGRPPQPIHVAHLVGDLDGLVL